MTTILEHTSSDLSESLLVSFAKPVNRWDDAACKSMAGEHLLLYRSNLLGSDLTVTNFGGGNTSAKLFGTDPISGEQVDVLWVKGSGGDIGSMKLNGFSTLYQKQLLSLESLYRGVEFEDEMVGYLPHCNFNLNTRAASIDTPLHAYLPFMHVDHVHPDAMIALAAAKDGRAATIEIWEGQVGWLDWKRPGFALGLQLRDYVAANSGLRGVMLAGHGIICWGDTSKECYDNTISLICDAVSFLNDRLQVGKAFGGQRVAALTQHDRRSFAASLMPKLRGLMMGERGKVGHFCDTAEAIEFVCANDFERLAAIGTSCPDHFLRTKIAPLTLDRLRIEEPDYLESELEGFRARYRAYHRQWAGPEDPAMRDPNPIVVLVPSIGLFTFAADKTTARLASEFYANAINVMRGAELVGGYIGLDEKEAFAIEYWSLEEAKLQRMPKPKPMVGKVVLITGAGGGIGAAIARNLLSQGACVLLTDREAARLGEIDAAFVKEVGRDVVRSFVCDVTQEDQVQAAFDYCAIEFGGLDVFVANAGLASSAPIEETTLALWRQNYEVLADGYFLTSRAAFPLLRMAKGGSIVFIGSKNAISATPNACAYASAKAAAVHLARCLALEGAPHGIRVNVVNPDAVIKGSRIWDGDWRKERAGAYGIDAGDELEDFYRNRSLLKQHVLPEDVAQAVFFFASDASLKSTGNIINVDAGNAQAFTR